MKNLMLLFSLCVSLASYSQTETFHADKKLKFGFNLGANYSNLVSKGNLPNAASISNGVGANMGLLMDYALCSRFHFSPKVELAAHQAKVDFQVGDQPRQTYKVFPVSLDVMTHMCFKVGTQQSAPYILAGPNLRLPIVDHSKPNDELNTTADLALDFGVGFDIVNRFFTVAPEIRYSFGLFNVSDNAQAANLNFHKITLAVNFK